MHPESDKPLTPEACPTSRSTKSERLNELFEAQRHASSQLHAELGKMLTQKEDLFPKARTEHRRLRAQFERAYELTRQAEAKIELVLSQYTGRL